MSLMCFVLRVEWWDGNMELELHLFARDERWLIEAVRTVTIRRRRFTVVEIDRIIKIRAILTERVGKGRVIGTFRLAQVSVRRRVTRRGPVVGLQIFQKIVDLSQQLVVLFTTFRGLAQGVFVPDYS